MDNPQPQREYIINDEHMYRIYLHGYNHKAWETCKEVQEIRSRPHTPPRFNSTELLLLAHDEWKRRQERKHLDDEPAWVSGFIGGFLTDKNWALDKIESLRTPTTKENP